MVGFAFECQAERLALTDQQAIGRAKTSDSKEAIPWTFSMVVCRHL
jgi:hypothetical protein